MSWLQKQSEYFRVSDELPWKNPVKNDFCPLSTIKKQADESDQEKQAKC